MATDRGDKVKGFTLQLWCYAVADYEKYSTRQLSLRASSFAAVMLFKGCVEVVLRLSDTYTGGRRREGVSMYVRTRVCMYCTFSLLG